MVVSLTPSLRHASRRTLRRVDGVRAGPTLLLHLRVQAPVRGRAVLPVVLDVDEPITKNELAVDVLAVVEDAPELAVREDELALACAVTKQ